MPIRAQVGSRARPVNTIRTAQASQSAVPLGPQFRAGASLALIQQDASPTVWRRAVFWPTTGRFEQLIIYRGPKTILEWSPHPHSRRG